MSRTAHQGLARVSDLLPRRKTPSSGEIANLPQVLLLARTLLNVLSLSSLKITTSLLDASRLRREKSLSSGSFSRLHTLTARTLLFLIQIRMLHSVGKVDN